MTRDDIIRMAGEAGFMSNSLGMTYTSGALPDLLERFAALVAATEREECAKVCETGIPDGPENGCCPTFWDEAAEACAKAIRARGQV